MGLKLDISAPQLILPRDLCDSSTHMVVFDLGKLKVTNLASQDDDDVPRFDLMTDSRTQQEFDMDIDDGKKGQIIFNSCR